LAGGYHFERIHIGYRYLHGQLIDAAAYTRLA
jgi:hypothetical protein